MHCIEHGRHTQARDWAQVHCTDGQDPWADYVALCRPCHRVYDKIGERQRGRVRNPHHDALGRFAKAGAGVAMVLLLSLIPVRAAFAATTQPARPQAQISYLDNAALNWAEGHAAGHPYVWGGAGPYGYDCSGLVMAAFQHVGISLPHSTYAMLGSAHLIRVPLSDIRRGDILFFGSGHVEFATIYRDMSFGAHDSGTLVGWIRWYPGSWQPTMAFEVG